MSRTLKRNQQQDHRNNDLLDQARREWALVLTVAETEELLSPCVQGSALSLSRYQVLLGRLLRLPLSSVVKRRSWSLAQSGTTTEPAQVAIHDAIGLAGEAACAALDALEGTEGADAAAIDFLLARDDLESLLTMLGPASSVANDPVINVLMKDINFATDSLDDRVRHGDLEHRLFAALNAVAKDRFIDPDARHFPLLAKTEPEAWWLALFLRHSLRHELADIGERMKPGRAIVVP